MVLVSIHSTEKWHILFSSGYIGVLLHEEKKKIIRQTNRPFKLKQTPNAAVLVTLGYKH